MGWFGNLHIVIVVGVYWYWFWIKSDIAVERLKSGCIIQSTTIHILVLQIPRNCFHAARDEQVKISTKGRFTAGGRQTFISFNLFQREWLRVLRPLHRYFWLLLPLGFAHPMCYFRLAHSYSYTLVVVLYI